LPDSSKGGGGGTRTQTQLLNEAANDPSALQNAAPGSPTLVAGFPPAGGLGGKCQRQGIDSGENPSFLGRREKYAIRGCRGNEGAIRMPEPLKWYDETAADNSP